MRRTRQLLSMTNLQHLYLLNSSTQAKERKENKSAEPILRYQWPGAWCSHN